MADHVLVTGGAGFVGSHMVATLRQAGADVTVVDNLRQGHRAAVPDDVAFIVADINQPDAIEEIVAARPWHAVFHFAALSLVGESMDKPLHYLQQNAAGGFGLIDACVRHGVQRFVLSSTANIFAPLPGPIAEDAPLQPASPYGESKLMIERALQWASSRHGLRSACLRYFNAAGADPSGRLGEDHDPETHLIPLLIDAVLERRGPVSVFGADYPTPDGTCIRDYIHVSDLCGAHLLAMRALEFGSLTYNLGNGRGYSVRDVAAAVSAVAGRCVPTLDSGRRPGDPAVLVAASNRIRADTGWTPRFDNLTDIVRTAYDWRRAHPGGYRDRDSAASTAQSAPSTPAEPVLSASLVA